jgi:hypothetical protein
MTTYLSEHFTLEEMIRSQMATQLILLYPDTSNLSLLY